MAQASPRSRVGSPARDDRRLVFIATWRGEVVAHEDYLTLGEVSAER